jgi:hypothetical protein
MTVRAPGGIDKNNGKRLLLKEFFERQEILCGTDIKRYIDFTSGRFLMSPNRFAGW